TRARALALARDENSKTSLAKPLKTGRRAALADVSNTQKINSKKSVLDEKPRIPEKKLHVAPNETAPMSIDDIPIAEKHDSHEETIRKARVPHDDLDIDDEFDPFMSSAYVEEIMDYLKHLEGKMKPDPMYMTYQRDLTWEMRSILVNWMTEVHWKFRLLPETLYLSINIMDRFLTERIVGVQKFQLVGIVALLVASKYEEILAPSIQNLVYLASEGYKPEDVTKGENYVLDVLGYSLGCPTPMIFLRRISKAEGYDIQTRTIAKYLMEITLLDNEFLFFTPSMIAAAAVWLARKMLHRGPWNNNLIHYSGYFEDEVLPCVQLLIKSLSKPHEYDIIYKKYSSRKFLKASIFVHDFISKNYK
ncbi:A/B/D/E cyclin, partial [Rozella allomycis CSF55]